MDELNLANVFRSSRIEMEAEVNSFLLVVYAMSKIYNRSPLFVIYLHLSYDELLSDYGRLN